MLAGLIRFVVGVIVGTTLFIPLTLIPLIGPVITGFAAARISKTSVSKSATIGLISGCLGFAFWTIFVFPQISRVLDSTLFFIFFWVFAIWNITSIFFTILGAVLGGVGNTAAKISLTDRVNQTKKEGGGEGMETKVFVVCPNCGSSNIDTAKKCVFCGAEITGK